MMKIFIVAVENSADHLGAQLAAQLRSMNPDLSFDAIGGAALQGQGLKSCMDISGLAILGFTEGLRSYPHILRQVNKAANHIMKSDAEAVILIDSWGFMIRLAKLLKKKGYQGQIIKYLAPQVWAMREGRAKILAKYVDKLLTIHNFEAPYFQRHGLETHYVGNPVFDIDYCSGDPDALRKQYNLGDSNIIAVLFGSRPSEIARLAQPFADAITQLRRSHPEVKFISPVSASVAKELGAAAAMDLRLQEVIFVAEAKKLDVMACAQAALACSGTVSSQLAAAGLPSVIAYRLAPMTYLIGKRLYRPDFISIVNIAAGKALMPEFMQSNVNGPRLAAALAFYLDNPIDRAKASAGLIEQSAKMRAKDGAASHQAARAIMEILTEKAD